MLSSLNILIKESIAIVRRPVLLGLIKITQIFDEVCIFIALQASLLDIDLNLSTPPSSSDPWAPQEPSGAAAAPDPWASPTIHAPPAANDPWGASAASPVVAPAYTKMATTHTAPGIANRGDARFEE